MAKTLYQMVYETIKGEINNNTLNEGDMIPSEKELAARFFTSRITIQRAMGMLAREGFVKRIPGCGTIVQKMENSKSATTIGVILSHISTDFGVRMFSAIEQFCSKNGINIIFKNSLDSSEAETHAIRNLLASNVMGILIQPNHAQYFNEELISLMLKKYPLVFLDRQLKGLSFPCVSTDNFKAANEATKKLFDAGHRDVSLITFNPLSACTLEDRVNGFKQAFVDYGIVCTNQNILTLNYNPSITREENESAFHKQIQDYITINPNVTAFLSCEIYCAQLLYKAISPLKLTIPDDFSLICFDFANQPYGPNITHIYQDQEKIGETAIKLLMNSIAGKPDINSIYVPYKIVDGETVTKPKK